MRSGGGGRLLQQGAEAARRCDAAEGGCTLHVHVCRRLFQGICVLAVKLAGRGGREGGGTAACNVKSGHVADQIKTVYAFADSLPRGNGALSARHSDGGKRCLMSHEPCAPALDPRPVRSSFTANKQTDVAAGASELCMYCVVLHHRLSSGTLQLLRCLNC